MFPDVCQSVTAVPTDVQGWNHAEPEGLQQFDQVGRICTIVHHQHMDLPGMCPDYAHRIVGIAGHQDAVTVVLQALYQDANAIVISDDEDRWKPLQFGPLIHRSPFWKHARSHFPRASVRRRAPIVLNYFSPLAVPNGLCEDYPVARWTILSVRIDRSLPWSGELDHGRFSRAAPAESASGYPLQGLIY